MGENMTVKEAWRAVEEACHLSYDNEAFAIIYEAAAKKSEALHKALYTPSPGKVYEVVLEGEGNNGNLMDFVEYVLAADFDTVSKAMVTRAEELGYTLKSIRYGLTVAETITAVEEPSCEDSM